MTQIETIKEIKRVALTMKDAKAGLAHIIRLCIDAEKAAGVYEQASVRGWQQLVVGSRNSFQKWCFDGRRFTEEYLNANQFEGFEWLCPNSNLSEFMIVLDDADPEMVRHFIEVRGFKL